MKGTLPVIHHIDAPSFTNGGLIVLILLLAVLILCALQIRADRKAGR